MTKQEFIKTISGFKKLSVVFAQTTRMPMVFCEEETADDFVYIFLEEEDAIEKAGLLNEEKQPAFVVNCKENEILSFLAELRLTGINAIKFVTAKADGAEEFLVQLDEFLKFPDMSAIPEIKRPLENPILELSMLYFMQEMRRPVAKEEKKQLAALEEEASANLTKSRFLLPIQDVPADGAEGTEETKRAIMQLKNEKGEAYLPLFTDGAELRKFTKGQKQPVMIGDFKAVASLLTKGNGAGIVLNPSTTNVVLTTEGVIAISKRFQ